MEGGCLYVLRGKTLSFSLVTLICSALAIWAWVKTTLPAALLLPTKSFDKLFPESGVLVEAPFSQPLYAHQEPSVEEEFLIVSPSGTSTVDKINQIFATPAMGSLVSGSSGTNQVTLSSISNSSNTNQVFAAPTMGSENSSSSKTNQLSAAPAMAPSISSSFGNATGDEDYRVMPLDKEDCNYAKGKWVPDDKRPLYSGFRCKRWLFKSWACILTQRPDFSYEKFRWQPYHCEMPDFEASKFLEKMRHKTIALVGDSLGRQQYQSLMCMVSGGKRSPEVKNVGREYGLVKAPGAVRPEGWAYRFPTTNTTILFYWSTSLCEVEPLNKSDRATRYAMHLDHPVLFLRRYIHRFDVLVLNTGHHWNKDKFDSNRWDMYVGGKPNNDKNLAMIDKAKNLTLYSIVRWVDAQLHERPGMKAFLRTMSPRHYVNGDWNTGGGCDNTTPLAGGSEVSQNSSSDPIVEGAVNGTGVKILDITALSKLRDEGHLSKYRIKAAKHGIQDCLRWCLPGIPDTWNEILFAQL